MNANAILSLLQQPETTVAVVGATDNPAKFGNRIYRDLKRKGFRVFAVNPTRSTVDGDPCYPSLADLPEAPTIVDFVVPPRRTLRGLEQCVDLGYTNVWIQPGAADPEVVAFVEAHDLTALVDACIMVEALPRR